jgi:hypothetical protein
MMRTSMGIDAFEPSRSSVPSCSTRSSFTCKASGMLSISSRNSVPPDACSSLPTRRLPAPVNAPASWPNISLSKIDSGTAPQFSAMNGWSRRVDSACRLRATSSLPVPVSPLIITGTSVAATLAIRSRTCAIAGDRPMMRVPAAGPASSRRSAWFSSSSAALQRAAHGFGQAIRAERLLDEVVGALAHRLHGHRDIAVPVTRITGTPGAALRQCCSRSSPLAPDSAHRSPARRENPRQDAASPLRPKAAPAPKPASSRLCAVA